MLLFQDYCTCTLNSELNVLHEDSEDAEDFESSEDEFSDEGIIIDISSSEDEDINNNLYGCDVKKKYACYRRSRTFDACNYHN